MRARLHRRVFLFLVLVAAVAVAVAIAAARPAVAQDAPVEPIEQVGPVVPNLQWRVSLPVVAK